MAASGDGASVGGSFGGLRRMLCGPAVDVPCRLLLSGLQVARVIGKQGVLIKELREESGAIINILDKQLPVAFMNRDERVLFVRGSPEQMRVAVGNILRLAFGGVNQSPSADENEDFKRTVEVMVPEASCAHLIGEKGARISGIMDETRCDLHIVREPVSGLAEQKRVRITGPNARDLELAISKVQELLADLMRFGALTDKHFDMREGPTDPADLVPRQRGVGSSLAVNILVPKEEVAWIIGKRGSKISKLRERARVNVNDAESPPFPPCQAIVEISAAPLSEEIHVLQMVIDDLMVRADASDTTRLLLPTEHFGAVLGQGGEVIARIARESGATLNQQPPEHHAGGHHRFRVLEISGGARERVAAASLACEAVERALGGAPGPVGVTPSASSSPLRPTESNDAPPPRQPSPPTSSLVAATQEEPWVAPMPGGAARAAPRPGEGPQPPPWPSGDEDEEAALEALAAASTAAALTDAAPTDAKSKSEWDVVSEAPSLSQDWAVAAAAPPQPQSFAPASRSAAPPAPAAAWSATSVTAASRPLPAGALGATAGASFGSGFRYGAGAATAPLFVLLPTMEVARYVASGKLGIAQRTGTELSVGAGATGEAILRISGDPPASAAACYLLQEALWMSGAFARGIKAGF